MNRYFWIIAFLLINGCSQEIKSQYYVQRIDSKSQFENFSNAPLVKKYGKISSVKVIYSLKTDEIYYINSHFFTYHYSFYKEQLGNESLDQFNAYCYDSLVQRDYLLANINFSSSLNRYFVDLSPFDQMQPKLIELLFQKISSTCFFGDKLSLLLNTDRLNKLNSKLKIPTLLPEQLFSNQDFQPISTGKKIGRLRFMEKFDPKKDTVLETDILVLQNIPLEIPHVTGIIVTQFQTPLSHISLLGQNRKIPICAYKTAFTSNDMRSWENKIVEFTVEMDTFYFKTRKSLPALTSKPIVILTKNTQLNTVVDIENVRLKQVNAVGNKAANFGELHALSQKINFKTPENAFVIPFYFYEKHIQKSGIQPLILQLDTCKDPIKTEEILKEIRQKIKKTPVDYQLLTAVAQKLNRTQKYSHYRFRSSTNAEDRADFSGAGLYESKTVIVNDTVKTTEKAIHAVWASLWSMKAYRERQIYGIASNSVSMGILVHRSFPNEAVNGVAITKNVYRSNYYGTVINAQLGDVDVVNPPVGVTCDQFIVYPIMENIPFSNSIEIITKSSLNHGKLVLSESEIYALNTVLLEIKQHYWKIKYHRNTFEFNDYGLDFEFKFDEKTRALYIKQVRTYNR